MILSENYKMSEDQAIVATAVSTNVIDLGVRGTPKYGNQLDGDMGKGTEIPLLGQVTANFNTLTSLTVTLETSDNADLSSSTVLFTGSYLLATLVAGKRILPRVLPDGVTGRYLGVRYTVVGVNPTLGQVSANIGEVQTNFTGV